MPDARLKHANVYSKANGKPTPSVLWSHITPHLHDSMRAVDLEQRDKETTGLDAVFSVTIKTVVMGRIGRVLGVFGFVDGHPVAIDKAGKVVEGEPQAGEVARFHDRAVCRLFVREKAGR